MASTGARENRAVYWEWFAVALFLLVTVDMLTTAGAAAAVGIEHEANPFVRWLLAMGVVPLAAVNLAAVVCATCVFAGLLELIAWAPEPHAWMLEQSLRVWLGFLVGSGVVVALNNMLVLTVETSLF